MGVPDQLLSTPRVTGQTHTEVNKLNFSIAVPGTVPMSWAFSYCLRDGKYRLFKVFAAWPVLKRGHAGYCLVLELFYRILFFARALLIWPRFNNHVDEKFAPSQGCGRRRCRHCADSIHGLSCCSSGHGRDQQDILNIFRPQSENT